MNDNLLAAALRARAVKLKADDDYADALLAAYRNGFTFSDIARHMGLSPNAVSRMLRRRFEVNTR